MVDGFPRTRVQVSCLKMFYDAMIELRLWMEEQIALFGPP